MIHGILLLLIVAGCDRGNPPGEGRTDSAPALSPEVDELYRVGRLDGDSWDTFGRIEGVAFDSEGRLHILDGGDGHVHIINPDGTHLRSFGRSGEGPGEFRSPSAIALLADGRIVIADTGHRAFLLFTPEGEFLESQAVGQSGELPGSSLQRQGATSVVSISRGFRMVTPPGGGPAAPPSARPIRRWDLDEEGDGEERVLVEPWRPSPPSGSGSQGLMFTSLPTLAPEVHLAVLPDGRLAVADSSAYQILIYGPDGNDGGDPPRMIGLHDIHPIPLGPREIAAEREHRLTELAAGRGPRIQLSTREPGGEARIVPDAQVRAMLEAQVAELAFWHEIPVITSLAADPDGRLWVERSGGIREEGPIDLLRPDGVLIGTIPPGVLRTPMAFGPHGLTAWVEFDEFDVATIRVSRLRVE